jgi:hypothetical protein
MSTLAASLQAQIDALDARLASITPTKIGADGQVVENSSWVELSNHRLKLEQMLGRATGRSRMFCRGTVKGLR